MKASISCTVAVLSGMSVAMCAVANEGQKARPDPVAALLAAPTVGNTPQPDFILKDCQETSRIEPQIFNYFSPAAMLGDYLGRSSNRNIAYDPSVLATIKVTLLEGTKHGEISVVNGSYFYEPTPDYLGKDKAIFMAEFEGKRYKIVVELHVLTNVMENMPTSCPPLNSSTSTASLCLAQLAMIRIPFQLLSLTSPAQP